MAPHEVMAPEKKAFLRDTAFRRFTDVLAVPMPKLGVEKVVIDYQERSKFKWLEESKIQYLDETGKETKALKEALQQWTKTKQAWRKRVPPFFAAPMEMVGLAPRGATVQEEQLQQTTAQAPTTTGLSLQLLFIIITVLMICHFWPLWDFLIDPEGSELYTILGLRPGATKAEIKKAYRKLAKEKHPDMGAGETAEYRRIRTAYEELLARDEEDGGFSDETKESNLQVVQFVGFFLGRMQEMAIAAAYFFLSFTRSGDPRVNQYVTTFMYIAVTIGFAFEGVTFYKMLPLLINTGRFMSQVFRAPTTSIHPDRNHVGWEAPRYLLYCVLPACVAYWIQNYFTGIHSFLGVAGRSLLGCIVICSFTIRQRPYIFLNHALKSKAFAGGNPLFSDSSLFGCIPLPRLLRAPIELIIDDVMACAVNVPAPFRIACFAIFFVSCAQDLIYPPLFILPWGGVEKWNDSVQQIIPQLNPEEGQNSDEKALAKAVDQAREASKSRTLDAKEKKAQRKQDVGGRKLRETYSALMLIIGSGVVFLGFLVAVDAYMNKKLLVSAPLSFFLMRIRAALTMTDERW